MPLCIRVAVDPTNPQRRLKLWDNGRLEPAGTSAPPPVPQDDIGSGHAAGKAPIGADGTFVALIVTSWTGANPSGWTFTKFGQIFEFGTAAAVPIGTQPVTATYPYDGYVDFAMDPTGVTGQGYGLGDNGTIINAGGSPNIDNQFLDWAVARRIYMPDWASKKYWILDALGRWTARHGAVDISVEGRAPGSIVWYADLGRAGVFLDNADAGGGDGWMVDAWGAFSQLNDAELAFGYPYHPGEAYTTDAFLISNGLGGNPLTLGVLNYYGTISEFTASTPPTVAPATSPLDPTTDTPKPTIGWVYTDAEGDQQADAVVKVFSQGQYLAGAVNEVQQVAITGSPTGGTFTLKFDGQATANVARNATAAVVQAAIEALPNVLPGDVVCTGGPLPGTPVVCTFVSRLAAQNWPQMGATNALTGGTSPAVVVTTTQEGAGIDPGAEQSPVWQAQLGALARQQRSVQVGIDLPNDTYRAYVQAMDSSGLWSDWRYRQWVQNVVAPAAPTLTASAGTPLGGIQLDVSVGVGALAVGALFGIEYRDGPTQPWLYVRDGFALIPDPGRHASVVDRAAPLAGVQRTYRARQYVPAPYLASPYSSEVTASIPDMVWTLTNPFGPEGLYLPLRGDADLAWVHKVISYTAWPAERVDPIVTVQQGPRSPSGTLPLYTLSKAEHDALWFLLNATRVYLLRDPWGHVWYCSLVGDVADTLLNALPNEDEATPTGHLHQLDLPIQIISRPQVGPSEGPLALTH